MKILKIEPMDSDKISVTVEGYPHAQPVFDANIKPEDLEVALKAWKVNQDEVDETNRLAKEAAQIPKPLPDISSLTALIGKDIK